METSIDDEKNFEVKIIFSRKTNVGAGTITKHIIIEKSHQG